MVKKRRIPKKAIRKLLIIAFLLTLVGSYYYSHYITPTDYKFSRTTMTSTNLPDTFKEFSVAYLSDININDAEDITRLKEIVDTLNKNPCDLVLFGGDLYDGAIFDSPEVINILKSIKSTAGKFAVQGEKDLVSSNEIIGILNESGFEVLHNEYREIHYKDSSFALFGLENNGDISSLLSERNRDMYKLVLVHEPDYFESARKEKIDLQLSGHSLGGYVHIPLIGYYTKPKAELYTHGMYTENTSTLLVSNGMGMESSHGYRFLCPNEVVILTLTGSKDATETPPVPEQTQTPEPQPPEPTITPEEPIYEDPVYEQPVYDEPIYDEPVYDEPVYDDPIYDESTDDITETDTGIEDIPVESTETPETDSIY